ncbi:MAG: hypothetical protein ACE5MM_04200 [Nitrospiraceae bacterium]
MERPPTLMCRDHATTGNQRFLPRLLVSMLVCGIISALVYADLASAKRKTSSRSRPALRIVSVETSAQAISPANATVDFDIEIEAPNTFYDETILEVSSLITSPSKTSVKFLFTRQPLHAVSPAGSPTTQPTEANQRVKVTLTWDGTDQTKQRAGSGRYRYEVRAKLLRVGNNGVRTFLAARPKRGTVEVHEAQGPLNEDPSTSPHPDPD